MKAQIETIIQSDETAQHMVNTAKRGAQTLLAQARQKAQEIIAQKEAEMTAIQKAEIETILSEARAKSQRILDNTDRYLDRLNRVKEKKREALIQVLFQQVLRS